MRASPLRRQAAAIEEKIFAPSSLPSSLLQASSGWGIRPKTLRPSLQMPAIFSNEPLGLAAAVGFALGIDVAQQDLPVVVQRSRVAASA